MKIIGSILFMVMILNTANASCLQTYERYVKYFKMSQEDATDLRREIEEAAGEAGVAKQVKLNNTTVMRWQKSLFVRAKELIREVEGKTQARVEIKRLAKGLKVRDRWVKEQVSMANKKRVFCPKNDDPADFNQIVFYLAAKLQK